MLTRWSFPLMNTDRFDAIVQYALSVTSQGLGAIHLLKYVYLADLAFADANQGESFTDVRWVFLHYGPWSKEAQDRIAKAAESIAADRTAKKRDEDGAEYVRFKGGDEQLAEKLRDQLPPRVASAVRWAVQEYGSDTSSLLDEVYRTRPMLRAAPGEVLALAPEPGAARDAAAAPEPDVATPPPKAAWKVRRERKEARQRIQDEVNRRLAAKRASGSPSTGRPPRYDEIYVAGLKWLDSLGGEPLKEIRGEGTVTPEVWKSPSRRGQDGS